MIDQIPIGIFFFLINLDDVWCRFLVDNFLLDKGVGKLSSLTVDIMDFISISEKESKALKDFKVLVTTLSDVILDTLADDSVLRLCQLVLYIPGGTSGYQLIQWFTGRLCTISPRIDASNGIQIGMTCYCLSKACELAYRPFIDFVYTPILFASDIDMLLKANVFYPLKITNSLFSASDKLSTAGLIRKGNIQVTDSVTDMLAKALETLQDWLRSRGTTSLVLSDMPIIDLYDYIKGDIYLADIVKNKIGITIHPYVKSLVEDFAGSMQQATILDALINTLKLNGRELTVIPASRADSLDQLLIIPCAISRYLEGDDLGPEHIISYSVGTNPMLRIREPDKIFVKAAYTGGWGAQDGTGSTAAKRFSKLLGLYSLIDEEAARNFAETSGEAVDIKVKLLYAPNWLFDMIIQGAYDETDVDPLLLEDLYENDEDSDSKEATEETSTTGLEKSKFRLTFELTKDAMDAYAQNMFYSTYRMHTQANIKLAISEYTLNLDKKLGKSIKVSIPTSASSTAKKEYLNFYGKLQNILYTYQAAKTGQSLSSMSLSCLITGMTPLTSIGSILYEEGTDIFYTKAE